MSCFSYSYTSNIVEEKTNKGLMQAFNQMNISISSMITEIENVSEQIYMNSILQKIVGISYRDILNNMKIIKSFTTFLMFLSKTQILKK
jgi:hypothetical protein